MRTVDPVEQREPVSVPAAAREVYFYVGKAAHPVYREQFRVAPDGFRYVASNPDLEEVSTFGQSVARRGTILGKLERAAKLAGVAAFAAAGQVRRVSIDPPDGTALVHSAQFLLRDSRLPYVVDFEDVHVFSLYQRLALDRAWARKRLMDAICEPACRSLLPWTETARRGFLAILDPAARDEVAARTFAVHPAIRPTATVPRTRGSGPLRVVFVGVRFFDKGGAEAVLAVKRLRRTHDVELDLVSFVPERWRRTIDDDPSIRVHAWLSLPEVHRLYDRSHVLLFPTHHDTFGWVVVEAQAAALPVVAPDHHALPELVEHEVSGLLIPHENSLFGPDARPKHRLYIPPAVPRSFFRQLEKPSDEYVDSIAGALARLAERPDEYEQLSAGALERVTTGIFSVEHRRRRLAAIYERALA